MSIGGDVSAAPMEGMMIIHKSWLAHRRGGMLEWQREGWYLFGLLPLYIRDCQPRGRYFTAGHR